MRNPIAALPMYDWPEIRSETDSLWVRIRDALREAGIDAPAGLTRDGGDLHALWRDPDLLFAQTCWGPLGRGLAQHVQVIGQPDYSDVEGGDGALYRSVVLMRHRDAAGSPPFALLLDHLRNARLAYNSTDSMSGYLALEQDLGSLDIFSARLETGSHRASIVAVAEGRADVCAVDCRSWALALRHEPAAKDLGAIAWTTKRKGLPYITSKHTSAETRGRMVEALRAVGVLTT